MSQNTRKRSRSRDSNMDKKRIKSNKTTRSSKVETEEQDNCAICLEPLHYISRKNIFSGLNCNHVFHASCIRRHCKQYDCNCPLCRRLLFQINPITMPELIRQNARFTTPPPLSREELNDRELVNRNSSANAQETQAMKSSLRILYVAMAVYGNKVQELGLHPSDEEEAKLYEEIVDALRDLKTAELKYYQIHGRFFPWREELIQYGNANGYTNENITHILEKIKLLLIFKKKMEGSATRNQYGEVQIEI